MQFLQESEKVAAEGLEMQHKCTNIRPRLVAVCQVFSKRMGNCRVADLVRKNLGQMMNARSSTEKCTLLRYMKYHPDVGLD